MQRPNATAFEPQSLRLFAAACCLAVAAVSGCQSWGSRGLAHGAWADRQERKIVQLAKQDPFPSPADLGIETQ